MEGLKGRLSNRNYMEIKKDQYSLKDCEREVSIISIWLFFYRINVKNLKKTPFKFLSGGFANF